MTPPAGADYQLELLTPSGTTIVAKSAKVGKGVTDSVLYPPNVGTGYRVRVKSQGGSFDKTQPYRLKVLP